MRPLDPRTDQPIEVTFHRYDASTPEPMRPLPGYPDDAEGYPDDELGVAEEEPARPRFKVNRRARRRAAALGRRASRSWWGRRSSIRLTLARCGSPAGSRR